MVLKAHPTKSVRITIRSERSRERMEAEIARSPKVIQDFTVQRSSQDMYLGMLVTQGGPKESCSANIELKRTKVALRVQLIKRLLKEERVRRLGWLRAAVGLLQGVVL